MSPFLIESFKATLEEVLISDLLVHVVDVNSRQRSQHIQSVHNVLTELGIQDKPVVRAYNKIDLVEKKDVIPDDGIPVSVESGENMDLITKEIIRRVG